MRNRILIILSFFLAAACHVNAKVYYVSAAGNDSNTGLTQTTAWQTINKVNASFSVMAAGDSILFRRGDTFFGALVVNKSGTSLKPIVISAYGTGTKPVISGFIRTAAWTLVTDGLYQASLPGAKSNLNLVTINGIPQALGRYPNADDVNGGYLSYESFSGATSITDNELTSAVNWTGAEAVIRKKLWVLDRCKITSHTGGTLTFTNTNSSTYDGVANYGYFFQNDPRTLDKFGEWYFNSSTKYLQMYFGTESPTSYTVQSSGIDTLLILNAKNYININQIAFEGANGNALYGINSSNVNIQNCDFTNAGTGAIFVQSCANLLIENCTTLNILSNAIFINNSKSSNVTIRNCAVKNTGVLAGMGQSNGNSYKGILASVSSNLLVEYNRVDTTGYVGIEFQGSNVTVKNNVVNYFDFNKDDAGGIYSYASGTDANPGTLYTNRVVRDNIVMNGAGAPAGRFSSSLFVSGIYMDGRTMNVDILNNTVFNNGKNGIHCNNPNNVNIIGNTSFNNLSAMSVMRWAWGGITALSVKNNIFYPKTDGQRLFYYTNSGLNEPVATTLQSTLTALGDIDSNYCNMINPVGYNFEIYSTSGGALIPTSPLSLEGWQAFSGNDSNSKKPAKVPVSYKLNGFIGANKFTNGGFSSNISGVTVFGTSVTGTWDNTSKINGGSLKLTFASPVANKYNLVHSPIGAISAAKKYVLRFSTYGTTQQGIVRAYLRKSISPYNNLVPVQTKSFGNGRKDHEFLFSAPTTDAGASFVIEIEQNSGTVYIDNVEFYEADATIYNIDNQLRFEYNDTKLPKTIPLDGVYTAVNGTVYNSASLTLQPYTSIILVKDTSSRAPLTVTAVATAIKCYGDSSIVTVSATGGTGPYTGTGTFTVKAGLFSYTVTDATGATATTTITITQPATRLKDTATAPNITVAGGTTTVTVTATGGTAPYTGTGTFSGISAGTYNYVVTDANGCTASTAITIAQPGVTYSLTTTAAPITGGSVSGSTNGAVYAPGTVVTLTATASAGYVFTGWSGDVTGTATSVTVTMNASKTVTANFQAITYTLTTAATPFAGGSISRSPNAVTYAAGTVVTLVATPAAGYVFTGWSGDATGTANSVTVTMDANKTVTANFQSTTTYALTTLAIPVPGGWVSRSPNAVSYAAGTVVTLTVHTNSGYVFTGWTGGATGTSTVVTVIMDAAKTVTVNFQSASTSYTLGTAAAPAAGGSIIKSPDNAAYTAGSVVALTATAAAGYVFTGWSGDATGTAASASVTMTANRSVTANFQPITYTLTTTATPSAGGTVSPSPNTATYAPGAVVTLTATAAAGYTFTGWGGDASGTAATATVTMSANKTVTANFQPITYTLTTTATPSAGGTISQSPTATSYAPGAVVTLTATPAAGYVFTGWSGDATGTATSATVTMNANKAVTANFQLITYTLTTTATPVAGGSVSRNPNAVTYAAGTVVTLTANTNAGYIFTGWSGAVTGTAASVTVTMDGNKTVTANFQVVASTYTLTTTATPVAGGSITRSPNTATYTSGSVVTLTATPAAGYIFTGWSGDATGTSTSATVTMNANKAVTANFQLITYTLTTTATPVAGGSVSTSPNTTTYVPGSVVTLTATPATGYTFTGWSGDATGTATSVTVTMNANKTVTANFQPIMYTLITLASPVAGGWISRSPNAVTYAYGTVVTLTVNTNAGYVFTGWSGNAAGTAASVTVTMDGNKTATVNFQAAATTYTLTTTASPVAGGSISRSPNTATYSSGAVVALTATPAAGYVFTGWSGDAAGTSTSASVTMNANKAVTANFQLSPTTLRVEDSTIGTAGLCSIDGTISNNSGASNGRSVNLSNSLAKGLTWSINAGATGTYNLKWRYANGSTSNTPYMKLIINGVVIDDSLPFPRTTGSSTFATTSGDFTLTVGNNTIRVESIAARATADIDWLEVTGNNPTAGTCGATARPAAVASVPAIAGNQKTAVYPNPARDKINIGFYAPETEKISIVILDEAGNTMGRIPAKLYPAGYNIASYDVSAKMPGIYMVMINGERNVKQALKFIVVH